jgi:tryptophan halogenase
MQVPETLSRRIKLFEAGGKVFREQDELFSKVDWLQVMIGQGIVPRDYHPAVDLPSDDELEAFLSKLRAAVKRAVTQMPTHQEVLAEIRAAGSG